MEKNKNKEKSNKKLTIAIIIIVALLLGAGAFFLTCKKDTKETQKEISIKYVNGDTIKIENQKKEFTEEKEIIITNNNKEFATYSLNWTKVENTFKDQSNLLYTIEGEGENSASLGKSQVPIAASTIFNSVVIKSGETHKYKIKVTYTNGQENKSKFIGTLKVKVNSVNNENSKEQEKEMEKQREKLEQERAKEQTKKTTKTTQTKKSNKTA